MEEKIDLFKLLSDMWKAVKAGWWLPFLLALAVGGYQYLRCDRSYTPYYETSATVFVNLAGDDSASNSYQNYLTANQMVTLFPYLLQNGVLTDAIQAQMNLEEGESLPGSISLEVNSSTNLLTFRVNGSDPEQIYALLQAVIKVLPDTLNYIAGPTEFQMFKDMGVPSEPANSPPSEWEFLRYAVGYAAKVFAVVLVLLALYGLTIRTISNADEVKQYLNAPNLGVLPSVSFKKRSNRQKNQLTLDNPRVPFEFGESLRMVRNRLERIAEEKESRVLVVTSTIPGEGKSTTAVNLAMALAQKGKKVLLVDGDLRKPSVANILQISSAEKGLHEVLEGKISVEKAVTALPELGLYVLLAGEKTNRSTDLLSSKKMQQLLSQLRGYADYIIVDTPPVFVLGDSMALGKYADGCIYIVRRERARRHQILEGFTQMAENGCPILGTILNDDGNGGSGSLYGRYGKYGKYGGYGKYGKYGGYRSYGYGGSKNS